MRVVERHFPPVTGPLQDALRQRDQFFAQFEGEQNVELRIFSPVKQGVIARVPVLYGGRHLLDDLAQWLVGLLFVLRKRFGQQAGVLFDHTVKQRLFGREIPVAQPLRHADGFGNVGDRRFFVSLFPKYLQGGVQNFLPAHLRLLGDPHPLHAPFLPEAMQAVRPARSQVTS